MLYTINLYNIVCQIYLKKKTNTLEYFNTDMMNKITSVVWNFVLKLENEYSVEYWIYIFLSLAGLPFIVGWMVALQKVCPPRTCACDLI